MSKTKILTRIVFVVIIIAIGVFVWKSSKYQQSQNVNTVAQPTVTNQQIQSKQTTTPVEEVSFCGKVYKTNEVMINGVGIVKRIAQIASQNPNNHVCDTIKTKQANDVLTVKISAGKNGDDSYINMQSNFKLSGNTIYVLSDNDKTQTFYGKLRN